MKIVFFIFIIVFLQFQFCFSQSTTGTAVMNVNWVVELNGSKVFTEYNTDVTQVGFVSQEQGEQFCLWFSDNLVEFKDFDFANKRVKVVIHSEYLRDTWTVSQWNEYLRNKGNQRKSEFPVIPF